MEGKRSSDDDSTRETDAFPEGPEDRGSGQRNDRRAAGRLVPPAPIAARVKGLHFARILNISRSGALAESAALVRPLERNELLIHFPRGPFITQARVQRCRAWRESTNVQGQRVLFFRSGFEFDSLSLQEIDLLELSLRVLDPGSTARRPWMPRAVEGRATRLADRRFGRGPAPGGRERRRTSQARSD